MKKLDAAEITARCIEISKCLIGNQTGMVDYDLHSALTTGDAARFAATIRNREAKFSRESLAATSAALKINSRFTETVIVPIFDELGWVKTKYSGRNLDSIIESIPPAEDVLSTLGERWQEDSKTAIDETAVYALSRTARRPYAKDALISDLESKTKVFDAMFDYGSQAGFLGKFVAQENSKEVICSPLFWSRNADKVIEFLRKQKEPKFEQIGEIADKLRKHPGIPDDRIEKKDKGLINAGTAHGFFPSVAVNDRSGNPHEYVFASTAQFDADEKSDVFEKARMIVSCIRHGQYHAEVSHVRYPRAILRAMRSSTMSPHSYAKTQYALLLLHNIVDIVESRTYYGTTYKVVWVDTPENNLAADIADSLLAGQEVTGVSKEDLEARNILVQGIFNYSSEQRRLKMSKSVVATKEYDRLMELYGGVRV